MEPSFFSYEAIATTFVIVLASCGSFVLVGNGVEIIRKWMAVYREKREKIETKVDFLKDENLRHNQDFEDIVYLKHQIGVIQESVDKIDSALDAFITNHNKDMKVLNEETALQTGAIKSLLDHAIDNNHNDGLISERKKFDEFLIHRGR